MAGVRTRTGQLGRRAPVAVALRQGCLDRPALRPTRRQQRFSNLAIETALTLRLIFHLPLRQAEGFVRSILTVMRAGLDAPDHTTLSRRSQWRDVAVHAVPLRGSLQSPMPPTGASTW